jgi:hypothetical protein
VKPHHVQLAVQDVAEKTRAHTVPRMYTRSDNQSATSWFHNSYMSGKDVIL